MRFIKEDKVSLPILLSAVVFVVFSLQATAQLDPLTLLQQAAKNTVESDTTQFDLNMLMEYKDGANANSSEISGKILMGEGREMVIHLRADKQEIILYNNPKKQHIYLVDQKTYREIPSEPNRVKLLQSMLSGPLETAFSWLADFLHGVEFSFDGPPRYVGTEEIDGTLYHTVDILFSHSSMRVYLSVADPSLLRRFVISLRAAELAKYVKSEEGFIRITGDFGNWKLGEILSKDTFIFSPPAGVTLDKPKRADGEDALKGKPAPDFMLPLLDGDTVKISQHRDRDIVILDFFASWCGPCRQAMPIVASVAKSFKDKNVVLYAVNLRESPKKVRAFLQESKLDVDVLLDPGSVATKYGVKGIPRLVIIGKDGIVKSVHGGMSPDLEKQLTDDINALL